MAEIHVFIILFFIAMLSATVVPAQGELVLLALLATGNYQAWELLLICAAANVCGTAVSYLLGMYVNSFRKQKWFPVKEKYMRKAEAEFKRHGLWTLLLAWVPGLGDPITITAGVLRVKFWAFLPIASSAKMLRYLFVWGIYEGIF